MSIIAWIVLGLIAGFIASKIVNKTGEGLLMDIVLGVVGAVVGGWLFNTFGTVRVPPHCGSRHPGVIERRVTASPPPAVSLTSVPTVLSHEDFLEDVSLHRLRGAGVLREYDLSQLRSCPCLRSRPHDHGDAGRR